MPAGAGGCVVRDRDARASVFVEKFDFLTIHVTVTVSVKNKRKKKKKANKASVGEI